MYVQPVAAPKRKPVTVPGLRAMKTHGQKIPVLTCCNGNFAAPVEAGTRFAGTEDELEAHICSVLDV